MIQYGPQLAVLDAEFPDLAAYNAILADKPGSALDGLPHGAAVAKVAANALDGTALAGLVPAPTGMSYHQDRLAVSFAEALADSHADVITASWGVGQAFADNFRDQRYEPARTALTEAAAHGRDGLGTVIVFAAGNSRQLGDDVNHHNFQNAPETIAVAALDADGGPAAYSTPGAAVLLAARGTDVPLNLDAPDGSPAATTVTGTSFAAPQVAAVAARMLDANAALTYRDVQTILARTAGPIAPWSAVRNGDTGEPAGSDHAITVTANGAHDWNGGGLVFDPRVGYGALDAAAAVRLATAWQASGPDTPRGEAAITVQPGRDIPDGGAPLVVPLAVDHALEIDEVQLSADITHSWIGDLRLVLVSPDGTRSALLDRPGRSADGSGHGYSDDDIDFTFSSQAFRGESSLGLWHVEIHDMADGFHGRLESLDLRLAGREADADDTYVYTDAFARLAAMDPDRQELLDTAGYDHLLAAAVSSDVVIDLTPGATSVIAGEALTLLSGTAIEAATGGAGEDRIVGNDLANKLIGGPGNDTLFGNAGDDTLDGGEGADLFYGGPGADTFLIGAGADRIGDFDPVGGDRVQAATTGAPGTFVNDVSITPTAGGVELALAGGSKVMIDGIDRFDADWFIA